jgi:hypothetical protein
MLSELLLRELVKAKPVPPHKTPTQELSLVLLAIESLIQGFGRNSVSNVLFWNQ